MEFPKLRGPYLGQTPPDREPEPFASTYKKQDNFRGQNRIFWSFIQNIYTSPQNKRSDIYWVDTKIIQEFYPEGFE